MVCFSLNQYEYNFDHDTMPFCECACVCVCLCEFECVWKVIDDFFFYPKNCFSVVTLLTTSRTCNTMIISNSENWQKWVPLIRWQQWKIARSINWAVRWVSSLSNRICNAFLIISSKLILISHIQTSELFTIVELLLLIMRNCRFTSMGSVNL